MAFTVDQQEVIDARNCNILVSAAAGSGKTTVLVERIVQLITDKDNPVDVDRILVVTFTEKAAAEMKRRIGDALNKKVTENPKDERLARQAVLSQRAFFILNQSIVKSIEKIKCFEQFILNAEH